MQQPPRRTHASCCAIWPESDAAREFSNQVDRAALRRDGADALVFNCTGEFPPMAGDAGVLFPSRVLNGLAGALLPRGRLGLLIPIPEQAELLSQLS